MIRPNQFSSDPRPMQPFCAVSPFIDRKPENGRVRFPPQVRPLLKSLPWHSSRDTATAGLAWSVRQRGYPRDPPGSTWRPRQQPRLPFLGPRGSGKGSGWDNPPPPPPTTTTPNQIAAGGRLCLPPHPPPARWCHGPLQVCGHRCRPAKPRRVWQRRPTPPSAVAACHPCASHCTPMGGAHPLTAMGPCAGEEREAAVWGEEEQEEERRHRGCGRVREATSATVCVAGVGWPDGGGGRLRRGVLAGGRVGGCAGRQHAAFS